MTPELWNLIGAFLVVVLAVILYVFGIFIDNKRSGDGGPLIGLGIILFVFGFFLVIGAWVPFGIAAFGKGG